MKKIALVGSTGSIGRQVIDVVSRNRDKFELTALIASASVAEFEKQLFDVRPKAAALASLAGADLRVPDETSFFFGEENALKILEHSDYDVAFIACGGFAGLGYTLAALKRSCTVALANKETLVCGGDLVMPQGDKIVPVDSEHSAIWQCLNFDKKAPFEELIITASGGAFRGRAFSSLSSVTPEEALNHPTWKMGKKITIDSATLLNKGYEVIEAHHLYAAPYSKISAVIQPQSIIHSMVRFADGAVMAQASCPTMELPIQLALTYPERLDCPVAPLNFSKAFSIDFQPLERKKYPLYDLALSCGEEGGVLPTALNAASEIADFAFLNGEIKFTDIYSVADKVVSATKNFAVSSYGELKEVDAVSRLNARKFIQEV